MIFMCGDLNQSIYPFLNTSSNVVREILSKSCEFREEVLFPKDRHFLSDKASDIRIDKSFVIPNFESTEDIWWLWKNLCHEIFKTFWQHETWHYLHERRDEAAKILDAKQELVSEYFWYGAWH
jgi:hypothetical protein